ncbi:MAG TPA: glycoside hydrolase family 15 protein [Acidimicrobiales bacterium]|nr:glycoside hydrolase family 15 protein [Acidimicrobiales bacterium]
MSLPIESYGIIGDTHSAALVGTDGSIDWLCLPRFDSPACFAKLLGDDANGFWRIAPVGEIRRTSRRYHGDSLVLETEFETSAGVVRLVDCMPLREDLPHVVRMVEGVAGDVAMRMQMAMRPGYGRVIPWVRRSGNLLLAAAGPDGLALWTPVRTEGEGMTTVAEFTVGAGQHTPFVLTWFPSHESPPRPVDARYAVADTKLWWQEWAMANDFEGPWRDAVVRSQVTLKALTYRPTGGIVAAATTSLPETIGGVRNWDYRYCWLRDATLTLTALMRGGFHEEALDWRDWLLRAVAGDPAELQIMYGPAGERRLEEWEVDWLSGYEGSRPVRVGNAASGQFQLDVYGEVMAALHQACVVGDPVSAPAWDLQRLLMDFVTDHWQDPDDGIWEVRGPRRHFTHSKVMAWVAVDRAVKMAEQFRLAGPVEDWRKLRSKIHAEVLEKGYDQERGAFTQYYGSDALDASVLMIPLVDFLPATDLRMMSTVEAIRRELTEDGFVLRYQADVAHEVDGLQGHEGAFLACSFWLADNLGMTGQREEATELFERLLGLRNDLGLLAEEYDTKLGRQVGNFPQAFSHVSLVNCAYNLSGRSTAEMSHLTSLNLLRRVRAWQSGVHPPGGSGHPLAHRGTRRPPAARSEEQPGEDPADHRSSAPGRDADRRSSGKEERP